MSDTEYKNCGMKITSVKDHVEITIVEKSKNQVITVIKLPASEAFSLSVQLMNIANIAKIWGKNAYGWNNAIYGGSNEL